MSVSSINIPKIAQLSMRRLSNLVNRIQLSSPCDFCYKSCLLHNHMSEVSLNSICFNRNSVRSFFSDSINRGSKDNNRLIEMELTDGQKKNLEDEVTQEKDRYLRMDVQAKRKFYSCGHKYVDLSSITSWTLYALANHIAGESNGQWRYNENINNKVSLFIGDITTLEIDCIVNAANKKLAGGGGVDGAIHKAAGIESLKKACKLLGGCETGDAKITGGYKLPAKYIVHTVGPIGEKPDLLKSCYTRCLDIMKAHNLKSIAFPCISTGVYRYPNERAAEVACAAVREWLDRETEYVKTLDRIIFCLFMEADIKAYKKTMATYFPTCDKISNNF